MDDYPNDIVAIQCHVGDAYETTWTSRRATFYGVTGVPTTWFDGVLERVGSYDNDTQMYNWYRTAMNERLGVPTDVTIELDAEQVGEQTFEISVTIGIEEGGSAKSMTVQILQVLDYYPASSDSRYRNCVRQDAPIQSAYLVPGGSTTLTCQFTLSGVDWDQRENVKIVAFAQAPGPSGPLEVYQAGQLVLIQPPEGDINGDGRVDIVDLALMLMAYGTCEGDAAYDPDADIDDSGCVDLSDLARLLANYGYGT
jgi:hypothetical protein